MNNTHKYIIVNRLLYIQCGALNDPVFNLLIKSLFQLQYQKLTQKERPLRGGLTSVNQVFNITNITSGNFFSTNCDVDYSMADVLSYVAAGLND
jgi:hypothetical protein